MYYNFLFSDISINVEVARDDKHEEEIAMHIGHAPTDKPRYCGSSVLFIERKDIPLDPSEFFRLVTECATPDEEVACGQLYWIVLPNKPGVQSFTEPELRRNLENWNKNPSLLDAR